MGADRLRGREEPPALHKHVCREAEAAFERGGEIAARQAIRRCFEEMVMLTDTKQIEFQQRAGTCMRVDFPAKLLASARPS